MNASGDMRRRTSRGESARVPLVMRRFVATVWEGVSW